MKKIIIPFLFLSIGASIIFYFLGNYWDEEFYYKTPYAPFYISASFLILSLIFLIIRVLLFKEYSWVLKNYIRILIVWAALGITITGLFSIFPPQKDTYDRKTKSYGNSNYYKVSALLTIVGALLIGGLGAASKKKIE